MLKRLTVLGSTGSIGVNTLQVAEHLRDQFRIVGLSANRNDELLIEQAKTFKPEAVCIVDESRAGNVEKMLSGDSVEIFAGREGILELAARSDVDLVMNGLVGSVGMEPTLKAVEAGVDVALSNKESLVMAGQLIKQAKEKSGAKIIPVDSEHSAIWQCLVGEQLEDVHKIILTGSGGPFRTRELGTFDLITPKEALNHPNWDMGNKITIDSATMMNKGLEVIETKWLFGFSAEQIEIVIHPQSIIHSMVEFCDGSVKAQLGVPDMKVPIQYALSYPRHIPADWETLDLISQGQLTFEAPDMERFPCIDLAYRAMEKGGTAPAVLNVANEQAVYRFLKQEIKFTDIPRIIKSACEKHEWQEEMTVENLNLIEGWATEFVVNFRS